MGIATSFDAERAYDDDRFSAQTVFENGQTKVVLGYFEPGQFIPVHAPASDLVVTVRTGTGVVRAGDDEHAIEPGSVVVVPANEERGIRADRDACLEATLVTNPPPTADEHELVRKGLTRNTFDPTETD